MSNPSAKFHPIGTIEVSAGEVTKQYEVAAWWTRFTYPAQVVTLETNGYYVRWTVEGTNVETYTPSLFAGNPIGGGSWPRQENTPSTHTFMPYAYTMAERIATVGDDRILLDSGVGVDMHTMDHRIMCLGYVTDNSQPIGHRYSPCECDYHLDAHGDRKLHRDFRGNVRYERDDRGFLDSGYKPHEVKTVDHYKLVGWK